ncbi:acetyltransferase [Streptomyces camponoticapitis]|uniref:Acetyltransferase n=1 Tax=Streptomyces camponoticapitis TaxID=1616125 RepID=A0ABQ2ETV1_9ACTN|nr:GNAT family N-acetyltransferase [Streptomyces camponoticapitis]GGK24447.1 acetyltransferase [Streptomyces camponoticapitis]
MEPVTLVSAPPDASAVSLITERLRLRPLVPDDIDAVHAACQDPDIQRWTTIPSPYGRQHAEHFVERVVPDMWRAGTNFVFAVEPVGGGPLLASVSAHSRTGVWEVGYWTVKEHRGRGYTTEALGALVRWIFTELGAERVEWRAEAGNEGSRAVALKAGFVPEGTLRAALLTKETTRDVWIGAILPSDLGLPSRHPYLPARARRP